MVDLPGRGLRKARVFCDHGSCEAPIWMANWSLISAFSDASVASMSDGLNSVTKRAAARSRVCGVSVMSVPVGECGDGKRLSPGDPA